MFQGPRLATLSRCHFATYTFPSARSLTLNNCPAHIRSNVFVHSCSGRIASALVRYSICLPLLRTRTNPTRRSTFKCFDTEGCSMRNRTTRSPTGNSPPASKSKISRRRGSATALKASEVVAARAMSKNIYSDIGICQQRFRRKKRSPDRRNEPGQKITGSKKPGQKITGSQSKRGCPTSRRSCETWEYCSIYQEGSRAFVVPTHDVEPRAALSFRPERSEVEEPAFPSHARAPSTVAFPTPGWRLPLCNSLHLDQRTGCCQTRPRACRELNCRMPHPSRVPALDLSSGTFGPVTGRQARGIMLSREIPPLLACSCPSSADISSDYHQGAQHGGDDC